MSDKKVLVTENLLDDIADAIREKRENQATYTPRQMAAAIREIDTEPELEAVSIIANGTYRPSEGMDGFNVAFVQVPTLQASITEDAIVLTGEQVSISNDAIVIDT